MIVNQSTLVRVGVTEDSNASVVLYRKYRKYRERVRDCLRGARVGLGVGVGAGLTDLWHWTSQSHKLQVAAIFTGYRLHSTKLGNDKRIAGPSGHC